MRLSDKRGTLVPTLFQFADVDTGCIKWINADEVSDVMWAMDGWPETVTN